LQTFADEYEFATQDILRKADAELEGLKLTVFELVHQGIVPAILCVCAPAYPTTTKNEGSNSTARTK
jgi:hypothetical protein